MKRTLRICNIKQTINTCSQTFHKVQGSLLAAGENHLLVIIEAPVTSRIFGLYLFLHSVFLVAKTKHDNKADESERWSFKMH